MEENIRKKYDRAAKIIGIIIGILFVLGISYAVFRTVTKGEQDSVISAGKLDVRIENEQDEITLENAFPITEEEGKKQTPYTFDVVNKGTINAEYDLYIEIDESVSTLPVDVVRYYLTVEEDGTEKIVTSSARTISQEEVIEKEGKKLYKIDNKYLDTDKSNHYKLCLWIDEKATEEQAINKRFEAKVSVEAVQNANEIVQQIDVSANGDGSATAYMYSNGHVIIKGKGNLANNLSTKLVYPNDYFVKFYKKVFIYLGCPKEKINSFTSYSDFENYLSELKTENSDLYNYVYNNLNVTMQLLLTQEVLEEIGYDTSGVELTQEALTTFMIEQGLMDEKGQLTEKGQEVQTKLEEKSMNLNPTIPFTSITLEEGITNIPGSLFRGNTRLKVVNIPEGVTTIADYAFSGCTSLTEVSLPSTLTKVGRGAFENCTAVKKLTVDGTINFGENASSNFSFPNLEELIIYGDGEMADANYRYPNEPWNSGMHTLKKIIIKPGITSIGDYHFRNFTQVKTIDIPNTVTFIDNTAFDGWADAQAVLNIENNKNFTETLFGDKLRIFSQVNYLKS